jgi:hypothetical protein
MQARSDALHARVRRFVDEAMAGATNETFAALARDIAIFQHDAVPPVRRLFAAAGFDPKSDDLAQIPALPTEVFRLRRVAWHETDERCFQTSATTSEVRGTHPMRTTATYAHAALAWARRMLLRDDRLSLVALVAPESLAPDSSLSFMVARFADRLARASYHYDGTHLDLAGFRDRVSQVRSPVLVAGTSFAFVQLADAGISLPLPRGSRVMQTGGFKGRSREIAAPELRRTLAALFAIPSSRVVGEYGMTELSSQLYQPGLVNGDDDEGYFPPPWLEVQAVDPQTLEVLPVGEIGSGRFVDLANVDGAMAVLTADRLRRRPDGAIELFGRQPGAPLRGCSLPLEPALAEPS